MHAEIIKIGNSRGIRLPKAILEQCNIKDAVHLTVKDHSLIITPCGETRAGWEESFRRMAKNKDDKFLDSDIIEHSWDDEEWEW